MNTFMRIVAGALLMTGSLLIMAVRCDDKTDSSKRDMTAGIAVMTSGTHCEKIAGYCSDLDSGCDEEHVGWTPWGCPDPGGVPDTGMCCIPFTSCAAVGGVCRLKTEDCPDGTGGSVFMDCPQGADGQCCIPFE